MAMIQNDANGPIGEQTLPFLSKSRSAPNTPRTAEEISTILSFSEDNSLLNGGELSKELQIVMLQQKLEFTEKQLEEKDRQLEHYKQLVKTLKDVLAEVSGRRYSVPVPSPGIKITFRF